MTPSVQPYDTKAGLRALVTPLESGYRRAGAPGALEGGNDGPDLDAVSCALMACALGKTVSGVWPPRTGGL